jgi:peptide/nickel transport system ATP-binding protein
MEACSHWAPGAVEAVPSPPPQAVPLLQLTRVTAGYGRAARRNPAVVAVEGVDLTIRRSSVVAVIGESGSGKSTLARVIAGLHAPAAGSMRLAGVELAGLVAQRSREQIRRVQLVFQSPDVALNPAQTVEKILGRPLQLFRGLYGQKRTQAVAELLDLVQLPAHLARRRPHELSGGQKQRVSLARALAAEPDLVLCDEVTSALDTVVATNIIALLRKLRSDRGLAFLFITHDVSMVARFADEVIVMYRGAVVERGATDEVLNRPKHPYTKVLVASVPQLRVGWLEEAMAGREAVLKSARDVALVD